MVCHPATNLDDLTLEHLLSVVGREFRAHDAFDRPVALKLIAVTDMRTRRRQPKDAPPSAFTPGNSPKIR